ncbi:hypothetical protein AAZX31_10G199700 [Glycine max]
MHCNLSGVQGPCQQCRSHIVHNMKQNKLYKASDNAVTHAFRPGEPKWWMLGPEFFKTPFCFFLLFGGF